MLIEDLLLAVATGLVALLFAWPIVRLLKTAPWRRSDPLAQAKERLRVAKLEAEAARLHREADRIYENIYQDALADERSASHAGDELRSSEQDDEERSLEEAPREKGKAQ